MVAKKKTTTMRMISKTRSLLSLLLLCECHLGRAFAKQQYQPPVFVEENNFFHRHLALDNTCQPDFCNRTTHTLFRGSCGALLSESDRWCVLLDNNNNNDPVCCGSKERDCCEPNTYGILILSVLFACSVGGLTLCGCASCRACPFYPQLGLLRKLCCCKSRRRPTNTIELAERHNNIVVASEDDPRTDPRDDDESPEQPPTKEID